jgi:hypothetical protein
MQVINRSNEQKNWAMIHSDLLSSLRPPLPTRSARTTILPVNESSAVDNITPTGRSSPDSDEQGQEEPVILPMGWSKENDVHNANPTSVEELLESNASMTVYKENLKQLPQVIFQALRSSIDEGWRVYDPYAEFQRIGIPDWLWRISTVNATYDVSPSYPSVLVVPSNVDDDLLISSASFRSRGRFPTLVWRNCLNNCSITRCSQPCVGISQSRNLQDEFLITAINQNGGAYVRERYRSSNSKNTISSPILGGKSILIVDARPMLNATANQAVGKGTESERNYENSQVIHMDIPNIHAIRKSLEMFEDACADEAHWLRNLDASSWFSFLVKILRAAVKIVYTVAYEERSVLVHCSDGWDRTSQLTSMSLLMLDPYYRTIRGFMVLVEKEWLSFGHKFGDRFGWTAKSGLKDEECSSIFQQFLECVYQCMNQSPASFEFNEELLLLLMEHAHSGWFGNFLFNCERERKESKIEQTGVSIWTMILSNMERYTNKSFQANYGVMIPVTTKHRMVVWTKWYFRWQERIWLMGWSQTSLAAAASSSSPSTYGLQDDNIGMQLQVVDGEQTFVPIQSHNNQLVWADDRSAKLCRRCSKQFGLLRRKHHCR